MAGGLQRHINAARTADARRRDEHSRHYEFVLGQGRHRRHQHTDARPASGNSAPLRGACTPAEHHGQGQWHARGRQHLHLCSQPRHAGRCHQGQGPHPLRGGGGGVDAQYRPPDAHPTDERRARPLQRHHPR